MDPAKGLIPVADGLFCFGGPFNLYVLVGEELALLEGGLSALYTPFEEALRAEGLDPSRITKAIVLHAHSDHLMALSVLKARHPEVRVYGSLQAKEALEREAVWRTFVAVEAETSRHLAHDQGLPLPGGGERLLVEETLEDGAILDLGGYRVEVISTPGHSPCSLSLLVDGEVLLVSDALGAWMDRSPEGPRPSFFWDLEDYIRSARRLEALGAKVLCLGHNGFLRGEGAIRAFFQGHWRRLDRLLEEISRVRTLGDYERLSLEYARQWHRDFLRFFPWEAHLRAVRVLVRRALEYLGMEQILQP